MKRRLGVLVSLLLVVILVLCSCGKMGEETNEVYKNRNDFYKMWKETYLKTDKYVTKEKQYYVQYEIGEYVSGPLSVPVTVSEAHGYGMLIVANMHDVDRDAHKIFDGMVRYYNAHRSDIGPNLMSWQQCDNGKALIDGADDQEMVEGPCDSATDGDMDIAYALLLADEIWGSKGKFNYKQMAIDMINDIMEYDVCHDTWTMSLGDWAYGSEPGEKYYGATRASDFIMTHMPVFAEATGDDRWLKVYDSTVSIINQFVEEYKTGILPDFLVYNLETKKYEPAPKYFLEDSLDGRYGYNSCRTPWRIGLDYKLNGAQYAYDFAKAINTSMVNQHSNMPAGIKDGYDLDGTVVGHDPSMCFVAPFLVIKGIGTDAEWDEKLYSWIIKNRRSGYYGDSIKMLALIIDAETYLVPTFEE